MTGEHTKPGKGETLTVSAVVCCWTRDRLRDIRDAVTSLRKQTLAPQEIIVVVDNESSLYSRLVVEMGGIAEVVLHTGPRGLSGARTTGAMVARSDLVAFLDDDAEAAPDWLEHLVPLFEDARVVAAGGLAVLDWGERGRPWWFPPELDWTVGGSLVPHPEAPVEVRNPHGHNMVVRRELFCSLGGFSTNYGAVGVKPGRGEEAEFCLRAAAVAVEGARVVLTPRARVRHKVGKEKLSPLAIFRRWWNEGYCKANLRLGARWRFGNGSARSVGALSCEGRTRVLDVERGYLRHLVRYSLMHRALTFRIRALWESIVILTCIATVGIGYLVGMTGHVRPLRSLLGER